MWVEKWPLSHIWLGVSTENQETADERIPLLLKTPAAVRWISAEPLLGPISGRWASWHEYWPAGWRERGESQGHLDGLKRLNWVVIGGESGRDYRQMDVSWATDLAAQCRAAGVPVWMKQDSGSRSGQQGRIPDEDFVHEFPQVTA
jgi:protein gp37